MPESIDEQLLRLPATKTPPTNRVRWLTALCFCLSVGMMAVGVLILLDARQEVRKQAEQASSNLVLALEREISRNILSFDLSLQGAADALRQPGIRDATTEVRQMALFDRASTAEFMGALLVIDASGQIIYDSTSVIPHPTYLGDRDYFRVHQEQPNAGLYVSSPYVSRLQPGDPRIAISRRIPSSDGRFDGIVVGALRLGYFQSLFSNLKLGSKGIASVMKTDGELIARYPFRATDSGLNLRNSPLFEHASLTSSGVFEGVSAIDGVERLVVFRRVRDLPLILGVGVALDDIYLAWWRKAMIIGSILTVLCGSTIGLFLMFRQELLRRMAAERALGRSAARLAEMANTDGLTGLANRRSFDTSLRREWKRAVRSQSSISLLMLDVDCFKLFNDAYGHQAGDIVLERIASCLQENLRRPQDFAARYGGEEFVTMLPDTECAGALQVAECIRAAVERLDIPHLGSPSGRVTVSIGLCATYPQPGDGEEAALKEADNALYDAKHNGRNRISYAAPGETALGRTYCPTG